MQIEHYKVEIKKLRESEAEIKALSVNYAALLKEKEVCIVVFDVKNVLKYLHSLPRRIVQWLFKGSTRVIMLVLP